MRTPAVKNKKKQLSEDKADLCNACREIGYCLIRFNEKRGKFLPVGPEITEKDITRMVPLKTALSMNTPMGKKLQQAHDLFHQDEFEQSSYLYHDMFATRNDCSEVRAGLAAALFFLKQYEEAAALVFSFDRYGISDTEKAMLELCTKRMEEAAL
jgi:hypothetical protein